jgi:hypothetical protein
MPAVSCIVSFIFLFGSPESVGKRNTYDTFYDGVDFFEEKEYRRQKRDVKGSRDKLKTNRNNRHSDSRRPKSQSKMRHYYDCD